MIFFWISLLGDVDAIEPSQDFCFYVLTFLTPHRALNVSIQKNDMVKCKHTVVFDDEGSFIRDKTTGDINWLREDNGNYMLDVWILPPESINQVNNNNANMNNDNKDITSCPRQLR